MRALDRRRFAQGLAFGLAAAAGLAGRTRAATPAAHRQVRTLMGTRVAMTVLHGDPQRAARAATAAWATMQGLADTMSRYRDDSIVAALGRAAGRPGALAVAPPVMAVLRQAKALAEHTDGAFDPTVGAYRDWHFGTEARHRLPDPARLQAQRARVGHAGLELGAASARLARAGMALDLGGVAKLPILAAGLQALKAHGVADAMLDGGGDVLCTGSHHGRPWRVGVRDPRAPAQLAGVIEVHDGVVASSGDYERGFDLHGRRYHHVLDPASGMPTIGVHGVALLASDVAEVNGLGAAIMVGGLAAGQRWLGHRPGVDALVVTPDGAWTTAGMGQRLQPHA